MKNVRVEYFAYFREKSGVPVEDVETGAATLGDLYDELSGRHGFALPQSVVRPVVDDEFRAMSDAFNEGDRVAFVPPVAGG